MKNLPEPESRTIQLMPVVFQEEPSPRAPASIKLPRQLLLSYRASFPGGRRTESLSAGRGQPEEPGEGSANVRQVSQPLDFTLTKLPTASPDLVFYGQRHRLGS